MPDPVIFLLVLAVAAATWLLLRTTHDGDDHEPARLDVQNHEGDE